MIGLQCKRFIPIRLLNFIKKENLFCTWLWFMWFPESDLDYNNHWSR